VIQLLVHDIAQDGDTGLWTVRFDREDDKRIKTVSSIRRVPVPPSEVECLPLFLLQLAQGGHLAYGL
jgi:hypothetical protein